MDILQYIECLGDTCNISHKSELIQRLNEEASKNFYHLADVEKHIEELFQRFRKESGMDDAYLWKSDNWGNHKQFFYFCVLRKFDGKTYSLLDGRCEFKTIEIL